MIPLLVKKIHFYYHKKWLHRFEQVIVANKKAKTTKNARRWTENELKLFAEVLADSLEKLALKKSANNDIFEHIKNTFEMEIDTKVSKRIILTK